MHQDISSIQDKIKQYANDLLGKDFIFREHQLEAIVNIVQNAISDVKQTVLEAPTGSGKSIIAILSAYALYKLYGKTSYILVSDLSLFEQYERDIRKLWSNEFGCIKGKENYVCGKNGCKVSQATCALQNIPIKRLANPSFKSSRFVCKDNCQYVHDYVQAVNAPITLMTYQLYFIQRNYVEDGIFGGHNKNFPERDLVICDECHNICDICQSHFAPTISIARPSWMDIICQYTGMPSMEDVRSSIVQNIISCNSNNRLIDYVEEYEEYVSAYVMQNDSVRAKLAKKSYLTKLEKAALFSGNVARQEHCKLEDMLAFIDPVGSADYVVKTIDKDHVTINFVFDSMMLTKYFHMKSRHELLMSATIGDFVEFAKISGLNEDFKRILIPSSFDFGNSPIMFSNENRMSFYERDASFPNIVKQVSSICRENTHIRGIIQTGSYANAESLKMTLPEDILERCLFYKGAVEKKMVLAKFLDSSRCTQDDSRILVGPTLLEGLNFPDDLCRFQICIKVPYAYLGNEYIKKKMQYIDGWYEYDAMNKICQGIGRGVRHKHDWCKTYILDGCVANLVERLDKFSSLSGRFKMMQYL